ncbi:MAG: replisome organizer [Oscillospiraceae bacterium]|nr:replisome organizer [Oscillospiraceae bacterium]
MAERRMFAKTIIDSDTFLDMPLSTQALYFHLSMRADDDGFINNPKKIQRMIGCCDDDLRLLIVKGFIIPFESGIVVIKHWKIHNYIQKDRYKPTIYQEEKSMLEAKENKEYTERVQNVSISETQVRLGKDSLELGKDSLDKNPKTAKRFQPPTLEEVKAYCIERKNNVDPERFIDYYTSNGWLVGKTKMKDWKAAVRTWEKNGYSNGNKINNGTSQLVTINGKEYEYKNGKYYVPHGCGIAVDPYAEDDLDGIL